MSEPRRWALCVCRCGPEVHQAVIVRPICVDPGNRVLFEGTLGGCADCDCGLYRCASQEPHPSSPAGQGHDGQETAW